MKKSGTNSMYNGLHVAMGSVDLEPLMVVTEYMEMTVHGKVPGRRLRMLVILMALLFILQV